MYHDVYAVALYTSSLDDTLVCLLSFRFDMFGSIKMGFLSELLKHENLSEHSELVPLGDIYTAG